MSYTLIVTWLSIHYLAAVHPFFSIDEHEACRWTQKFLAMTITFISAVKMPNFVDNNVWPKHVAFTRLTVSRSVLTPQTKGAHHIYFNEGGTVPYHNQNYIWINLFAKYNTLWSAVLCAVLCSCWNSVMSYGWIIFHLLHPCFANLTTLWHGHWSWPSRVAWHWWRQRERGIPDKNIAIQSSVWMNRTTITLFVIVSHDIISCKNNSSEAGTGWNNCTYCLKIYR